MDAALQKLADDPAPNRTGRSRALRGFWTIEAPSARPLPAGAYYPTEGAIWGTQGRPHATANLKLRASRPVHENESIIRDIAGRFWFLTFTPTLRSTLMGPVAAFADQSPNSPALRNSSAPILPRLERVDEDACRPPGQQVGALIVRMSVGLGPALTFLVTDAGLTRFRPSDAFERFPTGKWRGRCLRGLCFRL